jgi:sorting nexin-1/2
VRLSAARGWISDDVRASRMDGFDDLLAPSKRALEDNPFENPFAQHRSGSPDPWASFSSQLEHNPFSGSESTTNVPAFEPEPPSPVSTTSTDPLDSAITTEPEEHVPSPPRTPTQFTASDFKEDVLEEERQPTPEPVSKPTPEPEAKPTLEPAAAQPEPERTPIQATTSLPQTTESCITSVLQKVSWHSPPRILQGSPSRFTNPSPP